MLCHHKGVLPLCRRQFISRNNFPPISIICIYKYFPCTHIDHRFYREHHAGNKQHARSTMSVMYHIRLFMKIKTNSMTTQITYNTIMIFFCMFLNSMPDITNKPKWLSCLSTYFQTFFGNPYKLFFFRSSFPYNEHTGCICIISIQYCSEIYIYNISFLQNIFFFRYPMTYNFIDTCTYTFGKTFVIQACRNSIVPSAIIITDFIYFKCIHSSMYLFCNFVKHSCINNPTLSYTFYLFGCFYQFTRRHFLTFILPIHYLLIEFRYRLTR